MFFVSELSLFVQFPITAERSGFYSRAFDRRTGTN
jgi:hypothetical protein